MVLFIEVQRGKLIEDKLLNSHHITLDTNTSTINQTLHPTPADLHQTIHSPTSASTYYFQHSLQIKYIIFSFEKVEGKLNMPQQIITKPYWQIKHVMSIASCFSTRTPDKNTKTFFLSS